MLEIETNTSTGVHLLRARWNPRFDSRSRGRTQLDILGVTLDFSSGSLLAILRFLKTKVWNLRSRNRLEPAMPQLNGHLSLDDEVLQERGLIHDLLRFPRLMDRNGNMQSIALSMLAGQIFQGMHGASIRVLPSDFGRGNRAVLEGLSEAIRVGCVHVIRYWGGDGNAYNMPPDVLLNVCAIYMFSIIGVAGRVNAKGQLTPLGSFLYAFRRWEDEVRLAERENLLSNSMVGEDE